MAGGNSRIVIRGARLIDGNGGKPIDDATIVIEGNRFSRVATGKTDFPKEARVIEAGGKTVLPGLIDNHVHYRNLLGELFIAHGVTSVRDLGNPLDWILAQREAVALGKIAGPRIFCTGGGFYSRATAAHHQVPADPADAKKMMRELIKQGVDYAKIHLGVPLDIARAVAEEAHSVGFKLTGHLDTSILPYADAGVDGVEHASGCAEATIRSAEGLRNLASIKLWLAKFLACWTFAEREHYAEVTEFLAKKGTYIEPTMVLWGAPVGKREKWEREDYELLKTPGLSYVPEDLRLLWLDHYYLAFGTKTATAPEQDVIIGNRYSIYGIYPEAPLREGYRRLQEFLLRLVQAGGNVVTGTDAPAVVPGVSLHREMEFLVEAGFSPMQAIQAATKVGAQYLGQEKQLGTVEEGKLADLIIVRGDPLKDITQTRAIDLVMKDGEILDTSFHTHFTNPISRPYSQEFYGYPIPRLDRISRQVAFEREGDVDLSLSGKDFFPQSVVRFGESPVPTRFISQNELAATVPSHLLKVGTIPISVVNPKPHEFCDQGATSNAVKFIVKFAAVEGGNGR
ncbi:MAG: amidohydrolase family protein [Deltaproteobacteria bacterium]